MNWKIFAIVCSNIFFVSFPQNIIGCGPGIDPYDYYTSFFQNDLGDNKSLQPFYYTGFSFLYDDTEPASREEVLASEWASFINTKNTNAVRSFINDFASKDLSNLYFHLEKKRPLTVADSIKKNEFTQYFLRSKNLETLGYILFAKKTEPFVTRYHDNWDAAPMDSLKMHKQLLSGIQLYNAAKTDVIKLKYGYQIMRLAMYNNENREAITYHEKYISKNNTESILKDLCLSMKAGALYRTGETAESVYLYSKAFAATDVKKISNFISFNWAQDDLSSLKPALALCNNDKERANLIALSSLGVASNDLNNFREVLRLDPENKMLRTLAVREINKLEETLLTPSISTENGGKAFYLTWADMDSDSAFSAQKTYAKDVVDFFTEAAREVSKNDKGFYFISSAYVSYMSRDLNAAKQYLKSAKEHSLSKAEQDQLQLTTLLIKVNEVDQIDAAFEEEILPSLKWMYEKAANETTKPIQYYDYRQWKNFYRNLFTEVLAKKYHKQNDFIKETLCIGVADMIPGIDNANESYSSNGIDFLHNHLEPTEVVRLNDLISISKRTNFDNFLLRNNSIKQKDVIDFAGTSYLRTFDFEKAIEWLSKFNQNTGLIKLEKNPFIDLLYDREEKLPKENTSFSKLDFAKEMLRLQNLITSDPANAATYYYKMGLGAYNITYYGHTWELVEYYRSGSDGYSIPKDASKFLKEYHGCYTAQEYFKKAKEKSSDKELQARALFMMAKCAQKQVQQPAYGYNSDWTIYDNAMKTYFSNFRANIYFPELSKTYNQTKFYKEALSSCSYLKDFIKTGK